MTKATIELIAVDAIDANPHRLLKEYPFSKKKLDALQRSIEKVGLWEGIIGRRVGNRVQIAFGHHRHKAALMAGLAHLPIILRNLSDEEMLTFMGRENMEEYSSDFLVLLETWEAAWNWLPPTRVGEPGYPLEVAVLLGWTVPRADNKDKVQMNRTADACNAAFSLLRDGLIERSDLVDMSVKEAREICTRAAANVKRIKNVGKKLKTSKEHIKAATEAVAEAVKMTAKESREGTVAQKDLRSQVDVNAYKAANSKKVKNEPLFHVFTQQLGDAIAKILKTDVTAEKIEEVIKNVSQVRNKEEARGILRVAMELKYLSKRADDFRRRLNPDVQEENVVPLKAITGGSS